MKCDKEGHKVSGENEKNARTRIAIFRGRCDYAPSHYKVRRKIDEHALRSSNHATHKDHEKILIKNWPDSDYIKVISDSIMSHRDSEVKQKIGRVTPDVFVKHFRSLFCEDAQRLFYRYLI